MLNAACAMSSTLTSRPGFCGPTFLGGSAGSLPKFTQVLIRKNTAYFLTTAPTKRLHYLPRPSLIMGVKQWSRGENELNGFAFIVPFRPREIQKAFARQNPLIWVEQISK